MPNYTSCLYNPDRRNAYNINVQLDSPIVDSILIDMNGDLPKTNLLSPHMWYTGYDDIVNAV